MLKWLLNILITSRNSFSFKRFTKTIYWITFSFPISLHSYNKILLRCGDTAVNKTNQFPYPCAVFHLVRTSYRHKKDYIVYLTVISVIGENGTEEGGSGVTMVKVGYFTNPLPLQLGICYQINWSESGSDGSMAKYFSIWDQKC